MHGHFLFKICKGYLLRHYLEKKYFQCKRVFQNFEKIVILKRNYYLSYKDSYIYVCGGFLKYNFENFSIIFKNASLLLTQNAGVC